MTAAKRKTGFDAALVREMAALLNETGLSEIEFDSGDLRIRVAKAAVAVAAPPPVAVASASVPAAVEPPAEHPGLLTSPMVGVVYTTAEPDAPAFVKVGDPVAVGDTVLLIEAMKVFNPIKAHRAGRVVRIFVSNGVPVEYGEPLLLIE